MGNGPSLLATAATTIVPTAVVHGSRTDSDSDSERVGHRPSVRACVRACVSSPCVRACVRAGNRDSLHSTQMQRQSSLRQLQGGYTAPSSSSDHDGADLSLSLSRQTSRTSSAASLSEVRSFVALAQLLQRLDCLSIAHGSGYPLAIRHMPWRHGSRTC